jgi:hypothetical protein
MYVPYQRDPVSELFDGAARALLARAYARPGKWVGSRIADPSPRHRAYLAELDIAPFARDRVGSGMAKTRWARGFVRALYYQHKWWSATGGGFRAEKRGTYRQTGALVVEIGNVVVARGVIPRGRAVRVMLAPGGQVMSKAVARTADRETWANQGPAWADPGKRDW